MQIEPTHGSHPSYFVQLRLCSGGLKKCAAVASFCRSGDAQVLAHACLQVTCFTHTLNGTVLLLKFKVLGGTVLKFKVLVITLGVRCSNKNNGNERVMWYVYIFHRFSNTELRGEVPSVLEAQRAERIVSMVRGVRVVHANMQVAGKEALGGGET